MPSKKARARRPDVLPDVDVRPEDAPPTGGLPAAGRSPLEPQDFERGWWGNCANTFGEEAKQLVYAEKLGLVAENRNGKYPVYDLGGRGVLDVGGGPSSMLLRSVNVSLGVVVDPCDYPDWTVERYSSAGIILVRQRAEDFSSSPYAYGGVGPGFDEAWCYNVLQHVEDPERVCAMMRRSARVVRVFEWVGMAPHEGHPHELSAGLLSMWLGVSLRLEEIAWPSAVAGVEGLYAGRAAFGVAITG